MLPDSPLLTIQPLRTTSGLDPYVPSETVPWDIYRASHLLRRCGLYADPARIREIVQLDPLTVVNALVDEALSLPLPPAPPIASDFPPVPEAPKEERDAYTARNIPAAEQMRVDWTDAMMEQGLREKMALLWSNHLVTQMRIYFYAAYAHQYLQTLRTHALGNFKDLIRAIGINPAMVVYLNAALNRKGHPNENFGRELLELFTVGLDNYTQQDITELARALTGWEDVPHELRVVFNEEDFDEGTKTIFGQSGDYNYDSAIDLIFEQRTQAIAQFICRKIYAFFVYAEPDPLVVDEMAQLFIAEDFEVAPVVRALLSSEHFFDDAFIRSEIKTPLELFGSLASLLTRDETWADVLSMGEGLLRLWGQVPLDPPNVAGWKGNRSWITSGTLVDRWNFSLRLLRAFPLDVGAMIGWISDPEDPAVLAFELAEHLLGRQDTADQEELTALLLAGTPVYEWSISSEDAKTRIKAFVMALVQRPSFQLA